MAQNEKIKELKESLTRAGLNDAEVVLFTSLVQRLSFPKEDTEYVHGQFEKAFPFEGGISIGEALILIRDRIDDK